MAALSAAWRVVPSVAQRVAMKDRILVAWRVVMMVDLWADVLVALSVALRVATIVVESVP